jgi:uncharacterized protein YkwD
MPKKLLRVVSLCVAVGVVLGAAAPAGALTERSGRQITAVNALESQVLTDLNALRAKRGLRPLRMSRHLTAAANKHSLEMARRGYFSHDSANGGSFWSRVQRFYRSSGYRSWTVGENLLWSSPDVDRASALRMWMESPGHRANLLSKSWREIGLSAVHVTSAPGVFGGMEVTIVTADFGSRSR